ncbi:MAG: MOSC domain-containing protein [Nocardioides sp.]
MDTTGGATSQPGNEFGGCLTEVRAAPTDRGTVDLVVRRPAVDEREILTEAVLDVEAGLVGDNWLSRATSAAIETGRHRDAQLNVMNARVVRSLAATPADQAMAGDQLYLDLDLSVANLPVGSRLQLGDKAIIEVTAKPHTGCAKFLRRFGQAALDLVNSPEGRELRLRGLNARVVRPGTVRPGDAVLVIRPSSDSPA